MRESIDEKSIVSQLLVQALSIGFRDDSDRVVWIAENRIDKGERGARVGIRTKPKSENPRER